MRYVTAGDSHGEYLVGIVEGFPAGHKVSMRDIERDLRRRRQSYGRSARQKIEGDAVKIVSGIWKGRTTGAPLAILIENLGRTVTGKKGGALGAIPRPGHADLPGLLKYGLNEVPPVAERASARGTAMRVAIGSLAASALRSFGVQALAHVTTIDDIDADPDRSAFDTLKRRVARSPLYCGDKKAERRMIDVIKRAKKDGNSLGGVVEVIVRGVVPGIGSHANLNEKLDSRLGGAMMGIQSVKAVEIGDGLTTFRQKGFESHDALYLERGAIRRKTNYAGGIEGSMSNGEDIIMRLYAKPIPTSLKRLPSFDIRRMKAAQSPFVRSDVCVLPALGVIAEAVASWEIFAAMREKFGGDNISEMKTNYDAYVALLSRRGVR